MLVVVDSYQLLCVFSQLALVLELNCHSFLVAAEKITFACFSVWCGISQVTTMFINLCVFRVADLSHLCDAEQDRGCSADDSSPPHASWHVMKEPDFASHPPQEDHQLFWWPVGRLCGNACWESQKPLYPKPLRLRADGQTHTHQWLGHQRLSVGWAANEVWRDWLVNKQPPLKRAAAAPAHSLTSAPAGPEQRAFSLSPHIGTGCKGRRDGLTIDVANHTTLHHTVPYHARAFLPSFTSRADFSLKSSPKEVDLVSDSGLTTS